MTRTEESDLFFVFKKGRPPGFFSLFIAELKNMFFLLQKFPEMFKKKGRIFKIEPAQEAARRWTPRTSGIAPLG